MYFKITPWEVKGRVDYNKLIDEFGVKVIDDRLLERIKKNTGELHLFLRRGLFFSHRDLDWILDKYEQGEKFFLYTGRGPSGKIHLGHLIPLIFTKWLQEKFDAELYFQITDDEKFLIKNIDFDKIDDYTNDNILDIIAIGFDPDKTFIIHDTKHINLLYKLSIQIARHITFSIAKSVFGFKNDSNIGIIFFPAVQASPCFLPSVLKNRNIPCLIPAAIDQDPYWRGIARYVAPKLGFYKPAQIHSRFLPGLTEEKMSSSSPKGCIFTTDTPEVVKKKVWNAFSGGGGTMKEQREKGGKPDICMIYQYLFYFFEENDKKIKEIYEDCRRGDLHCGKCKEYLTNKINSFLKEHNKRREEAKDNTNKYLITKS